MEQSTHYETSALGGVRCSECGRTRSLHFLDRQNVVYAAAAAWVVMPRCWCRPPPSTPSSFYVRGRDRL